MRWRAVVVVVLLVLLVLGLTRLGWPETETEVAVPDHLGTTRDWQATENAALFVPVQADPNDVHARDYSVVIYDNLGKAEASE